MTYEMPKFQALPDESLKFLRETPLEAIVDGAALCRIRPPSIHMSGVRRLPHFIGQSGDRDQGNMVGPAVTMKMVPSRFGTADYSEAPYLHTVIVESAPPGSVVVIDGEGNVDSGCHGSLAGRTAARGGLAGVVVDGGVRDVTTLAQQSVPTFCKGVTPIAYVAYHEVQGLNQPVHCGGAHVQAGDIVVGSDSGVVVLPRAKVDEVIEMSKRAILPYESAMVEDIDDGRSWEVLYKERHAPKWRIADEVRTEHSDTN